MRAMTARRWLMMRRFLNPTTLTRASSTQSSSSSDVVSTTAADVADVIADDNEEDDPPYPGLAVSASSSSVKPVMPTLLQPRVVVYDGVCHLCHRGTDLNSNLRSWGLKSFSFFWVLIQLFLNRGEVGYQSRQAQEDQILLPSVSGC